LGLGALEVFTIKKSVASSFYPGLGPATPEIDGDILL